MSQQRTPVGLWALVDQLRTYLTSTSWCDWLEVGGSLGRGAGDERSGVDAAVGVNTATTTRTASSAALRAVLSFAPVAAHLSTASGSQRVRAAHQAEDPESNHHAVQYADGRQLSLVMMPTVRRSGLPAGSIAVLDRGRRLQHEYRSSLVSADPTAIGEWAFLAWWELGDADKHLGRGAVWQALASLEDARRHAWQLYAARIQVDYPAFGAVSVENGARPAPCWMSATYPTSIGPAAIRVSLLRLADGLAELTEVSDRGDASGGLRALMLDRLRADRATPVDPLTPPARC